MRWSNEIEVKPQAVVSLGEASREVHWAGEARCAVRIHVKVNRICRGPSIQVIIQMSKTTTTVGSGQSIDPYLPGCQDGPSSVLSPMWMLLVH